MHACVYSGSIKFMPQSGDTDFQQKSVSFICFYFRASHGTDIKAMAASLSENAFLGSDKFLQKSVGYKRLDSSRKASAVNPVRTLTAEDLFRNIKPQRNALL